ncbi:MAG: hypothetical protein AB7T14_10125 [Candidatus Methylacidiphilaceae bacterium]
MICRDEREGSCFGRREGIADRALAAGILSRGWASPRSTALALQQNLPLNNSGMFPSGIYNFLGFPDQVMSGMVTYQSDLGLSITLGGLVMSEQFLGYDYAVKIPTPFVLSATLFYATPRWEARLYVYNFTNEPYWLAFGMGANGTRTFNYEDILPGVPFWVQGTFVYKF